MERIAIYDLYDSKDIPRSPSEITLGQIFDYEIVIIDDSIFRNTDTLDSLGNGDVMTLLGVSSLKCYNNRSIRDLRDDFLTAINYAKDNEQIVILLEDGVDTKFPYIYANGSINRKTFWNTVEVLNEIRPTHTQ